MCYIYLNTGAECTFYSKTRVNITPDSSVDFRFHTIIRVNIKHGLFCGFI